jgi:carbohydrate-selective porin OprB
VPAGEAVLELSYQLRLGRRVYLQPDAQWIIHPAGWALDGTADVHRRPGNALVVGLRSSLAL